MPEKETLKCLESSICADKLSRLCRRILNEAIAITGADFGNVQLLNAGGTGIEIVAQRGFNTDFLRHFAFVPLGDQSPCCGRAAKAGKRVMIEDVETDLLYRANLGIARSVPFRAVQSTPILDSQGKLLGAVTTHFREPRLPEEQQLEALDLYLRRASGLIEATYARAAKAEDIRKSHADPDWFLHSMRFFQGLNDADKISLLKICTIREYPKDDAIFSYGDIANRMFIVLNGWVKIYNVNDRESGILLLTQGDEFGAASIFDGGSYLYAARTETKSQILELSAGELKKMTRNSPDLAENIMHILSEEIKQRQISEVCLRHKKATQRIGCLLLRLTAWMSGKGGTFRMPYKKAVAAAQLDMDQATFSRALADMKELEVCKKESEITIKDFSLLINHCCQHCPMEKGQCPGRRMKDKPESWPCEELSL